MARRAARTTRAARTGAAPALPPLPLRRALRRARRSLALRWLLVAAAASLAAAEVARAGAAVDAARDRWGEAVPVAVARRDLAAGDVVGPDDVAVERRPRAVVPDGALAEAPVGRAVTAPVLAGEPLVDARLAPDGLTGPAALVPAGWRAVAVPAGDAGLAAPAPPLAVGDRVDVLGPGFVDGDAGVVAEGAVVVHVGEAAVTVAVPAADADDVAAAIATATATLALRGAERAD